MSMTESEALKTLEDLQRLLTNYRHISKELTEANGIAISALSEVQELHAIGTVSEFRQLKEKATPKKIGHCVFYREMGYGTPWQCLTCGADQIKAEFSCEDGSEPEEKHTFCWMCGQKLDWNE